MLMSRGVKPPIDPAWLLVFVPLWVVFVFGMSMAITSKLSGWSLLAQRFRYDGEWTGVRWNWQSARMRTGAGYNNILTVGANLEGMYIHPAKLFSYRHPALFIPWSEVQVGKTMTFLFISRTRLTLGLTEQVPFTVKSRLAEDLKIAAGKNWPMETIG